MQNAFHRCLIDMDVDGARKIWAQAAPHLLQPKDNEQALLMLHHARTQARSVPVRLRYYSHHWLTDRNYPSALPDELKPKAERMYPKIVTAVGIGVKALSAASAPIANALQSAMSDAVAEMYADGVTDPTRIKARMDEAYLKVVNAG